MVFSVGDGINSLAGMIYDNALLKPVLSNAILVGVIITIIAVIVLRGGGSTKRAVYLGLGVMALLYLHHGALRAELEAAAPAPSYGTVDRVGGYYGGGSAPYGGSSTMPHFSGSAYGGGGSAYGAHSGAATVGAHSGALSGGAHSGSAYGGGAHGGGSYGGAHGGAHGGTIMPGSAYSGATMHGGAATMQHSGGSVPVDDLMLDI